jgi:hypothetical protein
MPLRPLPLEELISAPLRALVAGQGASTQVTADFISQVGFETAPEKEPVARTFVFEYLHPMPDPANPGGVIDTPARVRVPLIAMLPVPNFRISEATLTFGANVVDVKLVRRPRPVISLEGERIDQTSGAAELAGVYAAAAAPPGQAGPTLSMTIKMVQEPAPDGLVQVVNLLTDAITSEPKPR